MSARFVLERVSEPEIEPVTLAEAIQHLREYSSIDAATQDQITNLIIAGREWAEEFTGRALIDQQWRLTIGDQVAIDPVNKRACYCGASESLGTEIFLRRSPALALVSFVSVDANGDETAVDAANYELREADSRWPRIVALNGASWATGVYRIVFRAGYADRDVSPAEGASEVPERFKQAIKLWVEAHYDRDAAMMEKLLSVAENLLRPERVETGFA